MSYYKILSYLGNRKYEVEGLHDGTKRTMQIKYKNIVRLNESVCQIIKSASLPDSTLAAPKLIFVKHASDPKVLPIEEMLCEMHDIMELKKGCVVRAEIDLPFQDFYTIEEIKETTESNIYPQKHRTFTLSRLNTRDSLTLSEFELKDCRIMILREGWECVNRNSIVLRNRIGSFYEYENCSKPIERNDTLEEGQIISIESQDSFTLQEVADQLGTKYQDVNNVLKNIIPDNSKAGRGIDVYARAKEYNLNTLENVKISVTELYRLIQYLQRPDSQCKSIVHWRYYVNKKYPKVYCPAYLNYSNNPHKELIPYKHLNMDEFANLMNWLTEKNKTMCKDEYYSFFHLLHWSEQICFIEKVVQAHLSTNKSSQFDVTKFEAAIEFPQYTNINVLVFIHTLLKLHKGKGMLSNFDLYNIWKAHMPQKPKDAFGLALQDYVGTNLFCLCLGAIGFSKENWWSPNVYDGNKPVFHHFSPNIFVVDKRGGNKEDNVKIESTMESARDNRAFVLFRGDNLDENGNDSAKECFNQTQNSGVRCPVLSAIEQDEEYQKLYSDYSRQNKSYDQSESPVYFNNCPLISVPGWRLNLGQKYKDKCTNPNPPQVSKYRLWYNKNASLHQPFFCEGQELNRLHKEAGIAYSWCGGNACFTETYTSPDVNNEQNNINIYTVAIIFRIIADNNNINKGLFQEFHSRLNWLNSAASHFYCNNCGRILEASSKKKTNKTNAHTITWFECQNDGCKEQYAQIYINHCWNDKCRHIVDSRETLACPNHIYICSKCGVCCGEKMFERKKRAGLSYPPFRHFEEGKYYCYKCGRQLKKQGSNYYCEEHSDVCVEISYWKYGNTIINNSHY